MVTFHPFDHGAALHVNGSHKLCVLNTSAATLWCLLDGANDINQLAQHYARRFKLAQHTALADVETILAQFNQLGLLSGAQAATQAPAATNPAPAKKQKASRPSATGLFHTGFTVSDQHFILRSSNAGIIDQWSALIKPQGKTHTGRSKRRSHFVELLAFIDANDPNGRFQIWKNDRLSWAGISQKRVVPHIVYEVFSQVCAAQHHRLLIHAAVLARNGRAIVMPGQAGAGKSTLTAALAASGWTYLSDELALIDPGTLQVAPYPMPIGLKNKSVAPLAEYLPCLANEPVHTRMDNRQVRYIMPNDTHTQGNLPIAALVFPGYQPEEPTTTLYPMEPLQALRQLAATGSSDRALRPNDIQALLTLAQRPTFALKFNNMKKAVTTIENEIGDKL